MSQYTRRDEGCIHGVKTRVKIAYRLEPNATVFQEEVTAVEHYAANKTTTMALSSYQIRSRLVGSYLNASNELRTQHKEALTWVSGQWGSTALTREEASIAGQVQNVCMG